MVIDETMSGWGRSGKWFGIEHFDVVPDIITTAKGLTSGYVQLGAMIWNKKLWDYFYDHPFVGGLTYGGHALACATGIANIEVYKSENLVENSAVVGEHMKKRLLEIKEKHACVGDVRSIGLWAALELTSDKKTKAPLAGFNNSIQNVVPDFSKKLADLGLTLFAKWDFVFIAPPLLITKEQVDTAVDMIDEALKVVDSKIK